MAIQRFEQLEAWQYAHKLVLRMYRSSRSLPADERFGLVLQLRRAAVSVPANIAEGFKRRTSKDKVHFYNISESSLEELRYYIILCRDLEYWKDEDTQPLSAAAEQVARLLGGLIRSIRA
jgi:four helix bundle protein